MTRVNKILAILTTSVLLFVSLFSFAGVYAEEPENSTLNENITEQLSTGGEAAVASQTQGVVSGAVYRIKQRMGTKYLTVNPNSGGNYDANMNNVSVAEATGGLEQQFRIVYNSTDDIYYIKPMVSSNGNNRVVDVNSTNLSQITDGANIHIFNPGDENSSQWQIVYSAVVDSYHFKINCKPEYSMEMQNNNNVELGLHHGGLNQSWALERADFPTSISLDKSHLMIPFGDVYTLNATLSPSYSNSSITWLTDNPNVATVNQSGMVTMQGIGTATITARISDSIYATCFVSSLVHPIVDDHIKIYSGSLVYNCNSTLSQNSERNANQDFKVTYYPSTGYYRIYSPSLQSYVGLDWRIENAPNFKYYFIDVETGKYLSVSSDNTKEMSETPYSWSIGPCYTEGITRNSYGLPLPSDEVVIGDYWDYAMGEEPILIRYNPQYYEITQLAIDAWNDLETGVVLGFATDETANGAFIFTTSYE